MADEILAAALDIETRKYTRNMNDAVKQARSLDAALDKTMRQAGKTDKALNSINGDISVNVDVNANQVADAKAEVKSLDGASAKVDVNAAVDKSEVDSLLKQLAVPVTIAVGVATAGAGAVVNEAVSDRAAIGAFALATGQSREDAAAIGAEIEEVWAGGLAESKTQIAGIAAQLHQAGVDIGDIGAAANDAFVIAAATGQDVSDVVRAQITLVKTGLAPSFTEASDLIAGGFAKGLNYADDLLDTINEYSRDFADLGLSGETVFSILEEGMQAGAYNTDKVADAFRELKIRTDTALSTGTGTEFEGLKTLGLLDEAEAFRAGEITGEQWVRAVLDTVSAANLDAVVTGAFGSPIEDLGVGVFEAINDALGNPELQSTWQGTTDAMRETLTGNLDVAFKRAYNAVVNDLARGFQIAGQPLTDLLDTLPERLNEFADHVQGGAGIPESLEFALEAPGLSEDIRQLQATTGGFIIEFQLAIASFLESIGQGGAAANIRTGAIKMAQGQLAFDIQYLDPDQASAAIATALRRGVDESGINAAITEAGENLIDADQLKRYQSILEGLKNTAFLPVTATAGGTVSGSQLFGVDLDDVEAAKNRINEAVDAMDSWWRMEIDFGEVISFDTEQLLEAAGYVEKLGKRTAESDDALITYGQSFDGWGDRVVSGTGKASAGVEAFGDITLSTLEKINQAAMVTQQHLFDAGIDPTRFAALTFGHTVDPSRATDGSHAMGLDYVPFDGYVGELHKGEMVLPAAEAALYRSVGGATTINTVNINVSQTLNAGGMAQASSAGQRFANSIRGY